MGIRERTWEWNGKQKSAWIADYYDAKGKRRLKTFKTKKAATDWAAETRVQLNKGTHIADGASITIAEAGKLWIETGEESGLVWSTMKGYREHLRLHIEPLLGKLKLSKLTVPSVRQFRSDLRTSGCSQALTRKVLSSLGSLVSDAQERGLATHNPVREMSKRRGGRRTKSEQAPRKKKLVVGVDIPLPAEIRTVINAAKGYDRAFTVTAALTGLRASELRALRWSDVDLVKAVLHVRQRADKQGTIDVTKSEAGERTVPLSPLVVNTLREWKLACPRRDTGRMDDAGNPGMEIHYVFPNNKGNVQTHENIVRRHWHPLQVVAGVSVPAVEEAGNPVMATDDDGKPVLDKAGKPVPDMAAKYTGLHCLRHFYASWCAARVQDGGLGLPLKTVQTRLGHSTLAMTSDTYGHLFPATDDAEVLAAGERALMGS
jgi:integrase